MAENTETLKIFDVSIEHFSDRSIRWLLESSENVQWLLEKVASDKVERMDFSRLEQKSRSFIPDNLLEQESDLVFSIPFEDDSKTGELLIYILIEHQSTVDVSMGLRILLYIAHIFYAQRRRWLSENVPKSQWRLNPILPIVFYTGDRRWLEPITLENLFVDVPEEFSEFLPHFKTLFFSVKDAASATLTESNHPFGWLMQVLQKEHASKAEIREALRDAVQHLNVLDVAEKEQWRQAINYLYLLIFHRRPTEEHDALRQLVQKEIHEPSRREEGEAMAQTMAERLIQQGEAIGLRRGEEIGLRRGEEIGQERGKIQAKRDVLLKLLHLRLESVPEAVRNQILTMESLDQLDSLIEKAATAQTLDDMDWDIHEG